MCPGGHQNSQLLIRSRCSEKPYSSPFVGLDNKFFRNVRRLLSAVNETEVVLIIIFRVQGQMCLTLRESKLEPDRLTVNFAGEALPVRAGIPDKNTASILVVLFVSPINAELDSAARIPIRDSLHIQPELVAGVFIFAERIDRDFVFAEGDNRLRILRVATLETTRYVHPNLPASRRLRCFI